VMDCSHRYHEACISRWLRMARRTCPMCRNYTKRRGQQSERRQSVEGDERQDDERPDDERPDEEDGQQFQ